MDNRRLWEIVEEGVGDPEWVGPSSRLGGKKKRKGRYRYITVKPEPSLNMESQPRFIRKRALGICGGYLRK